MSAPTAAERAAIRGKHAEFVTADGWNYCSTCSDIPWPCDAARLLDALEAAEAKLKRVARFGSEVP